MRSLRLAANQPPPPGVGQGVLEMYEHDPATYLPADAALTFELPSVIRSVPE